METRNQAEDVKTAVLITSDKMGQGDDELGLKLMVNYIKNIKELDSDLWRIIFLNGGVKLTTEGSEVIPILKELEAEGVVVLVCTTCLNFFGLMEKKAVGTATNMPDIINATRVADKVITL